MLSSLLKMNKTLTDKRADSIAATAVGSRWIAGIAAGTSRGVAVIAAAYASKKSHCGHNSYKFHYLIRVHSQ